MATYRALFARPGARLLALACGLGWLTFGSYGLAIVLAVQAGSGSFAVAGAAVAGFAAGSSLLAPVRGRFVDRRGPRAVAVFAPLHTAGLALLLAGCLTSAAPALLVAASAAAGATAIPLIATARAVWPAVAGPELARAGHALNGALGDAAQVVGPAFTGAVAGLASPAFALALLIPGPAIGALMLAAIAPPAEPAERRPGHRVLGVLRESAGLRTLALCDTALGLCLGALDVALPATAARAGAPELAAVPLALYAAGSVVTSVWTGSGRLRRPAAWRYLAGSLAMGVAVAPCFFVRSLAGVTLVLIGAGACYGVLNVALFELLDDVVAADRAVEALTWLTSLAGAGIAAGAALAGHLAQGDAGGALVLVAAAPAAAAVLAVTRRATLR